MLLADAEIAAPTDALVVVLRIHRERRVRKGRSQRSRFCHRAIKTPKAPALRPGCAKCNLGGGHYIQVDADGHCSKADVRQLLFAVAGERGEALTNSRFEQLWRDMEHTPGADFVSLERLATDVRCGFCDNE